MVVVVSFFGSEASFGGVLGGLGIEILTEGFDSGATFGLREERTGSGIGLNAILTVKVLFYGGLRCLPLGNGLVFFNLFHFLLGIGFGCVKVARDALIALDHYEFSVIWMFCHTL